MKKSKVIVWVIMGCIFLSVILGVVHSLNKGRCVEHTHEYGMDAYFISIGVYFIIAAAWWAVYRYYRAVRRKNLQ